MKAYALAVFFSLLGASSFAAGKPAAKESEPAELRVRKLFLGLSDKARISLRGLTDECLSKVARLPKATQTEWCKADVEKRVRGRRPGHGYEEIVQQLSYQMERCSEAAERQEAAGQTKEQRTEQCRENLKRQIESIKERGAREDAMLRRESEECDKIPGARLEQRCHVLEDAYRNMIDRQLTP